MKFVTASIALLLLYSTVFAAEPLPKMQLWTLPQAVAYALQHNPDTAIAKERIALAEAVYMQTGAGDFPQVSIGSEYSITNNPMYSFGNILNQGAFNNSIDFNDPGRSDRLALQTEIRYQIYSGGKVSAAKEMAQADIAHAQISKKQIEKTLGCAVVKNWQRIIQAQEMVEVRQETINTLQASLKVARARYDAGDLLRQELLAIEAQTAKVQEQRIAAEHTLALAKQGFLTLLGLPKQPFSLQQKEVVQQLPPTLNILQREELKALNQLEHRAQAELEKAKGSKRPSIETSANYTVEYGPELDGDGHFWQAAIRMNYPLFDGHASNAQIAQLKARLREIRAQKQKTKLALQLELEQARLGYQQAKKRLSVTLTEKKAAQEAARLSRLQFEEGTVLASTLIDYETRLADACARHLNAKADAVVALANLRRAAGYKQFEQAEQIKQ